MFKAQLKAERKKPTVSISSILRSFFKSALGHKNQAEIKIPTEKQWPEILEILKRETKMNRERRERIRSTIRAQQAAEAEQAETEAKKAEAEANQGAGEAGTT